MEPEDEGGAEFASGRTRLSLVGRVPTRSRTVIHLGQGVSEMLEDTEVAEVTRSLGDVGHTMQVTTDERIQRLQDKRADLEQAVREKQAEIEELSREHPLYSGGRSTPERASSSIVFVRGGLEFASRGMQTDQSFLEFLAERKRKAGQPGSSPHSRYSQLSVMSGPRTTQLSVISGYGEDEKRRQRKTGKSPRSSGFGFSMLLDDICDDEKDGEPAHEAISRRSDVRHRVYGKYFGTSRSQRFTTLLNRPLEKRASIHSLEREPLACPVPEPVASPKVEEEHSEKRKSSHVNITRLGTDS